MAIAWHESGWRNDVVSHKGAQGIGQIMPEVGVWIASDLIGRPELDASVSEDNIRMSARYVRWLIGYMGDEDLAIAAYYQGPGSVKAGRLYESTERYVASVQAHRPLFESD
ncbi:MAG: lytic transglycosylase domain-containing protein [Acidimicrobiales bacterium]